MHSTAWCSLCAHSCDKLLLIDSKQQYSALCGSLIIVLELSSRDTVKCILLSRNLGNLHVSFGDRLYFQALPIV